MYIKSKQKSIGLAVLVCTLMILFVGTANAAETLSNAPLEKITIAYSSISGHMAPLWITQDRGFFRKYGLDVQLVFIESGSTAVKSLISKDVGFAQMAGAGVVQSHLQGNRYRDDRRISQYHGLSADGREKHQPTRSSPGKDISRQPIRVFVGFCYPLRSE